MHIELTCQGCKHAWHIDDEPRDLLALHCPACQQQALPRAAEDLATSLEDALCQLGLLGAAMHVRITLDSAALPKAFAAED